MTRDWCYTYGRLMVVELLLWMHRWSLTNSAGVIDVACVIGGDIKPDSAFHGALVSPALASMRPLQYDRCLLPSS